MNRLILTLISLCFSLLTYGQIDTVFNSEKRFIDSLIIKGFEKATYSVYSLKSSGSKILICDSLKTGFKPFNHLNDKYWLFGNDTLVDDSLFKERYLSFDGYEIISRIKTTNPGFNQTEEDYIFLNQKLYAIRDGRFCLQCNPHFTILYLIYSVDKPNRTIRVRAHSEDVINAVDDLSDTRFSNTFEELYLQMHKLKIITCKDLSSY